MGLAGSVPPQRSRADAGAMRSTSGGIVAAVVVTHNSAGPIGPLLADLRAQLHERGGRVIVIDSASSDATIDVVRRHHPEVELIALTQNVGYGAALNTAFSRLASTELALVLNPDVRLMPGAIDALVARAAISAAAVVVPRMCDEHGGLYHSLRREPTVGRQLADAVLGSQPRRPARWASETVLGAEDYESAHEIDWATGAALLVTPRARHAVAGWDEQFFLYSEETDYLRRVRDAGLTIWFEPDAQVRHTGGGSGRSPDLDALLIANKVAYTHKHSGPVAGALARCAQLLSAVLRIRQPGRTHIVWCLLGRTAGLAAVQHRANRPPAPRPAPDETSPVTGSIIVPAHDEAGVIDGLLSHLETLAASDDVEVIVVCNGCADDTAERARAHPGIRVEEIPAASKPAALRRGNEIATRWPRLYVDADVVVTAAAARTTLASLQSGPVSAARPVARYDTHGADRWARAYYRARARIPQLHERLWGAGVYGLSQSAGQRVGQLPDVVADDLWVDRHFTADQIQIIDTDPVVVRVPRSRRALSTTLRRVARGNEEVAASPPETLDPRRTSASTARSLLSSMRGPRRALDAVVFAALTAHARATRLSGSGWGRDESTRGPAGPPPGADADHVIVTRFNLPTAGKEGVIRARPGWLEERSELFDAFCAPSVAAQTDPRSTWLVYLDPASPEWLLDRMRRYADEGLLHPVLRTEVTVEALRADIERLVPRSSRHLITTNLDNDDALASDFVARLRRVPAGAGATALFLTDGLVLAGGRLYRHRDRDNAFCSVIEPWGDPRTCWADWHNLLHRQLPVSRRGGAPSWLQVVHGHNVSNRVRGRLSPVAEHRDRFATLPHDLLEPSPIECWQDTWLSGPARDAKLSMRSAVRLLLVRLLGKQAFDRLKSRFAQVRRRR